MGCRDAIAIHIELISNQRHNTSARHKERSIWGTNVEEEGDGYARTVSSIFHEDLDSAKSESAQNSKIRIHLTADMCEIFISISCRQTENCRRKEEITFLAHPPPRATQLATPHRGQPYPAGNTLVINPTHSENTKKAKCPCIFIAFRSLRAFIRLRNIFWNRYRNSFHPTYCAPYLNSV